MTSDQKRDELREKIETAEARNAERTMGQYARDARDSATGFVKAHPIATVAGGLAIGVLIAAVVPARGRKLSVKLGRNTAKYATLAAELGMAYGSGLLESANIAARAGQDRLEDVGDAVGNNVRSLSRTAAHRAGDAADAVSTLRRGVTKKTGRAIRNLRSHID